MTKDELIELALEALEDLSHYADLCELFLKETHTGKAESLRKRVTNSINAITAIKEALAQPEQLISDQINYGMSVTQGGKRIDPMSIYKEPEQAPVAWDGDCVLGHCGFPAGCETSNCCRANYTTPPQRKPLTDEEIRKANHHMVDGAYDYSFKQGVKWAEYKHGIKGEA